ncbi:MAG: ATP synthase F0 subunit B [Proteobacteria bacterium]|nr:ATP synthase F0 subunit B [Pseudomonadota bacterium]MBU1741654.1 ATP synthase F0 subunit B [Pseudomonadota bacterium]
MISINATLIVQVICFLVLLLIMNRIFIRPVKRLIEEREAFVKSGVAETDRFHDQAAQGEIDYGRKKQEAIHTAGEDLNRIKDEVNAEAWDMIQQTRAEAEAFTRRLSEQVAAQVSQARVELETEIEALAGRMVERVLGRRLGQTGGSD